MSTVEAQLMDIPVLPLRNRVLLPGSPLRLSIGRAASIDLVKSLWDGRGKFKSTNTLIVIVAHRPKVVTSPKEEGTPAAASRKDNDLSVSIGPEDSSQPSTNDENSTSKLYEYGTLARVTQLQHINATNAKYSMVVNGVGRVRIDDFLNKDPFFRARVTLIRDRGQQDSTALHTLSTRILELAKEILGATKTSRNGSPMPLSSLGATKQFLDGLKRLSPGTLADLLVSTLKVSVAEKQQILEAFDLATRLEMTLLMMEKQAEMTKVTNSVHTKVVTKLKSSQREYYLREQLKAIQEELGSIKGDGSESKDENILDTLKNKLAKLDLPDEGREQVNREIARASKMNPAQPEHSIIINYLQWMAELPWCNPTVDSMSIDEVQAQLDEDHYGLQKVKTRLVEFLAVRQLHERLANIQAMSLSMNTPQVNENGEETEESRVSESSAAATKKTLKKSKPNNKSPSTILCLVGPPGVGKTSLGSSVATALGRTFYRMALGGVHDEAELRGHRRTYIGAMPGNIIQGMKKAGTSNPVFLLDEIDKMGRDHRGDPTAALLEILDPAQNHSFVDHYLNVPFDLSEVLFIATANNIETIPPPLRDRMEIIQIPGYTLDEKMRIAKAHLLPKAIGKHALEERLVHVPDDSLKHVVTGYTREAGVRTLERQISALCRRVAVLVAKQLPPLERTTTTTTTDTNQDNVAQTQNNTADTRAYEMLKEMEPYVVDDAFVSDVLGPNIFESEAKLRVTMPGVATGMAWTQVGGELLFIEATQMPGSGRLMITGNVRDVMRESCQAALSWLKSNAGILFSDMFRGPRGSTKTSVEEEEGELVMDDIMNRVIFQKKDLHIHFPAGAVPKDGPSAGCAITAALTSLWLDRNVRSDTSMTGEISLRGSILPVGGIKSKVLAAHREGIRRVVLPKRNKKDARDIPEDVQKELTLIFVDSIEELLDAVLEGGLSGSERPDHLHSQSLVNTGNTDASVPVSASSNWNVDEKLLSNM